jgi:hypothetical protein
MTDIVITSKYVTLPAFRYICETLFEQWYCGCKLILKSSDYSGYSIAKDELSGVWFESLFFEHIYQNGFDSSLMDLVNIFHVDVSGEIKAKFGIGSIPVIFQSKRAGSGFFTNFDHDFKYDVLGMSFFMLARLEEFFSDNVDQLGRHRGKNSLSQVNKYLDIPVVDIYSEIFINYLNRKLNIRLISNTKFETIVSCDVDNPYLFNRAFKNIIKRAAADLLLRRDLVSATYSLIGSIAPKSFSQKFDPFSWGIDYIIDINNRHRNVVQFNFIPFVTDPRYDGFDGFNSEPVKKMFMRIKNSGHKVGIHPGFNTFNSQKNMIKSINQFKKMQRQLGFPSFISGRQHYLRWQTGVTEALLMEAGVNEDSSLSYADYGGFRCGTCKPHLLFDISTNQNTKIKELPLIVMETTYFGKGYLNLKTDEIFNRMNEKKKWCKKMNGTFSILWHNCGLQTPKRREIYEAILSA